MGLFAITFSINEMGQMFINSLFVIAVVVFNSAAMLLLKRGSMYFSGGPLLALQTFCNWQGWLFIGGAIFFYVASLIVSVLALTRMEVSFFNPFISLTFIMTALGGAYFYHESLGLLRLMGIFTIMIGVVLVAQSSN